MSTDKEVFPNARLGWSDADTLSGWMESAKTELSGICYLADLSKSGCVLFGLFLSHPFGQLSPKRVSSCFARTFSEKGVVGRQLVLA